MKSQACTSATPHGFTGLPLCTETGVAACPTLGSCSCACLLFLPFPVDLRSFLIRIPGTSSSHILHGTLHVAENRRTSCGKSHRSRGTCSYDATVEKGRERNHLTRDDVIQRKALFALCVLRHTLFHERCMDSPFFCSKSMEMDSVLPSGERQNSAGGFSASEK